MTQLFTKNQAPRSKPIRRMHVHDAGCDGITHFICSHCGYDDGWQYYPEKTLTDLKRGLPCPRCNGVALLLHVKDIYFQEAKAGNKPFEFRLDNEYWRKRLIGIHYDIIIYMSGYPKRGDTSKIMVLPYRGYEMQAITHEHFGAQRTNVFAIRMATQKTENSTV